MGSSWVQAALLFPRDREAGLPLLERSAGKGHPVTEGVGMRGAVRHVEWVGDDAPERLEAATITLAEDRLDALGTSRTTDYVTSWSLETGPGWVTSRLDIAVFGRGFTRRLTLARDAHGRWTSEATQRGTRLYLGHE